MLQSNIPQTHTLEEFQTMRAELEHIQLPTLCTFGIPAACYSYLLFIRQSTPGPLSFFKHSKLPDNFIFKMLYPALETIVTRPELKYH